MVKENLEKSGDYTQFHSIQSLIIHHTVLNNITTLLNDLEEIHGEVICIFNSHEVFDKLRDHPRSRQILALIPV